MKVDLIVDTKLHIPLITWYANNMQGLKYKDQAI